jgi:hypothetical protein
MILKIEFLQRRIRPVFRDRKNNSIHWPQLLAHRMVTKERSLRLDNIRKVCFRSNMTLDFFRMTEIGPWR